MSIRFDFASLKKRRSLYLLNHYARRFTGTLKVSLADQYWRVRALGSSAPTDELIRSTLAARFPAMPKRAQGQLRIMYVSIGDRTYNEPNLYAALRRFGELDAYEPGAHPSQFSRRDWARKRRDINRELLRRFRAGPQPDLVMGEMTGWLIEPDTLRVIRSAGIPIVNTSWDDRVTFYGRWSGEHWTGPAALCELVDLNLTSTPGSVLKYRAHGALATFWPEGANPAIHKPHELPFEHDVSFVGAHYGYRPILVRYLRQNGIRVAAFGPGWDAGKLDAQAMIRLYSVSRVNLGFGGMFHMQQVQHLKGRDFEVPMSGGLYLTSHNPDLAVCYEIGTEILCYRSKRDCLEKVRWLLAHPEAAASIRAAGRSRALRDHTWDVRLQRLFRLVGLVE